MRYIVDYGARTQRIKLSNGCPVSDKFRVTMDAWLADQFGFDCRPPTVQPGQTFHMVATDTYVINPVDEPAIRQAILSARCKYQ